MLTKDCHITIPQIDYPQVYVDLMRMFKQALIELGISVTESKAEIRSNCLNVIFAPWGLLLPENELLFNEVESLAEHCALFNVEQTHPESRAFTERMIGLMRRTFNFDYYPEQSSEFQRIGCAESAIRFLWHPSMRDRVIDVVERDIDILFVGCCTTRRMEIFSRLEKDFGLKVTILNDVWGRDVDAIALRSKIAINIKSYETNPSFEVLRCLPMIASGAVVISENKYKNIYDEVAGMVEFCDVADIGLQCQQLLQNPDILDATRQKQYEALVQTSFFSEVHRGWSDWIEWLSKPSNRHLTVSYDQLDLSRTRPERWRYDTLYLHPYWSSSSLVDIQKPLTLESIEQGIQSKTNIPIEAHEFKQINTGDSIARMVDPVVHIQAWAKLLNSDGKLLLSLPYYLSPNAYDYPTYMRPYSEHSLKAFVGKESFYFREKEYYLEMINQSYLPTNYGTSLLNSGVDFNVVVHTPDAISHVEFVLVKRIAAA